MLKFDAKNKAVLDGLLLEEPEVRPGKMFGYPAYYVGSCMFACLYEEGVGLKVPETLATELMTRRDVVPFCPHGKARMREWIQINHASSTGYLSDAAIFRQAIEFAAANSQRKLAGKKKPVGTNKKKRKVVARAAPPARSQRATSR
jgi:hypothetical protein